jgi:cobalt/nickel transport system permease protein
MHLPDHFLDPATMAVSAVLSGGAVTYALVRVRSEAASKALPAAGLAAGIFAAQMVNFPIATGTSGHLLGGALAGMILGPWAGLLAMSAVLAVQAIAFGDGGILALGANILNMGLIGVAIGVLVQRLLVALRLTSADHRAIQAAAAALAGWLSVITAALACAIEMAVSGTSSAGEVVPAMLGVHALIGLAEGAITAAFVTACAYAAMFCSWRRVATDRYASRVALICAVIIVVALAPLASTLPDGLESVAEKLSWIELPAVAAVPPLFADYAVPGVAWPPASTVLAGLLGVVLVYSVTVLAGFGVRRSGTEENC